jgi:hypothetical protein
MSYLLCVFCASDEPVALRDIAEFINDGVFFPTAPAYLPEPVGALGELAIRYQSDRKAVRVTRLLGEAEEDVRGEAIGALHRARASDLAKEDIRRGIEAARQVIAFEIDRSDMTESAWAMLDCLENELITSRGGILYAEGDGFFGDGLERIASLRL